MTSFLHDPSHFPKHLYVVEKQSVIVVRRFFTFDFDSDRVIIPYLILKPNYWSCSSLSAEAQNCTDRRYRGEPVLVELKTNIRAKRRKNVGSGRRFRYTFRVSEFFIL